MISSPEDYLLKYESEYQYLFDRLQKLRLKESLSYKECISLPNECRRVLESIAVFKFPFEPKHDTRIRAIRNEIIEHYLGDKEVLEQSLDYIYRYSNTESHLQLFDDGEYFHNNPIEAKTLIGEIINFIGCLAPEHLQSYTDNN